MACVVENATSATRRRSSPSVGEEVAQGVDDAFGRALRLVRGRYDSVRKQPERPCLDRDGLREGAADVDADPDRAAHARTACAARRRHGRIPKTQAVPRT